MAPNSDGLENNEICDSRDNEPALGCSANETLLVKRSGRNRDYARLSQQNAQQRERLALLGASALVFAHEAGNPLQAVFGSLEFIETEFKRRPVNDPSLMSMIQLAMREVHRLRDLLREFRFFANPQALDVQLADPARIIEEAVAQQKLRCRAADIAVKLAFDAPLPRVMLDAAKITQVIANLCKNAVEAMPNGGCLSIRVYPSDPMIVVEIADSGVGVPGDVDVFQLFTTTKPDGSGLGLPIAQEIISAHKGTINYITELGRGTTFTVKLPAKIRN